MFTSYQLNINVFTIAGYVVIIIESIQLGYFGFTINHNILDPIIVASLLTIITLFVYLIIILILKRMPYIKKLIGAVNA